MQAPRLRTLPMGCAPLPQNCPAADFSNLPGSSSFILLPLNSGRQCRGAGGVPYSGSLKNNSQGGHASPHIFTDCHGRAGLLLAGWPGASGAHGPCGGEPLPQVVLASAAPERHSGSESGEAQPSLPPRRQGALQAARGRGALCAHGGLRSSRQRLSHWRSGSGLVWRSHRRPGPVAEARRQGGGPA
jgi:hypothetical protein